MFVPPLLLRKFMFLKLYSNRISYVMVSLIPKSKWPLFTKPSQYLNCHDNIFVCSYACCVVLQLCLTLCYSIDCSLPDSSVHGIFPSKNTGMGCHAPLQGCSLPRNRTHITYISCITSRFFTTACAVLFLVTQLCLTLCDSMDCNPPGAPVHRDSAGKNTGVG